MKRIWIGVLALVCVLLAVTGCGSLFAGDTRVELPEPTMETRPSAKTSYRDASYEDKYGLDGQRAFYISETCSQNPDDIMQFECLDFRESDSRFVYAYQAMKADGGGKMLTEMLSYNPKTGDHKLIYSNESDPSVEPAFWAQKVEMADGEVLYYIYFGGTGWFYQSDGTLVYEVPLKPVYKAEMDKLGELKDVSILSMAVLGCDEKSVGIKCVISMNLLGERTTVDENTEWSEEQMGDDYEGQEDQVFRRIDFYLFDCSAEELWCINFEQSEHNFVVDESNKFINQIITNGHYITFNGGATELTPEMSVTDLFKGGKVTFRDQDSYKSDYLFLSGHIEQVKDIVYHEGESDEEVIGQKGLLMPGSFVSYPVITGNRSMLVPGKPGKSMDYLGSEFGSNQPPQIKGDPGICQLNYPTEWTSCVDEIQEAGYATGGGFVFMSQKYMYYVPVKEDGSPDMEEKKPIFLSSLYKGINLEINITSQRLKKKKEEPETEPNPQQMDIAKMDEGDVTITTGAYDDKYKEEDNQLMDGLNQEAVELGAQENQDTVEAGAQKAGEYDKDQLKKDGLVIGDSVLNPDTETNPDWYRAESIMPYGKGILVTSPGSGIVYMPFGGLTADDAQHILGYPMYRTWRLADGGYISVGFDDNSKEYLQSDMPFAKVYYLELGEEPGK